jgi:hypothetical protein
VRSAKQVLKGVVYFQPRGHNFLGVIRDFNDSGRRDLTADRTGRKKLPESMLIFRNRDALASEFNLKKLDATSVKRILDRA